MNEKLELKLDVPSVNSVTRWLEYLSNSWIIYNNVNWPNSIKRFPK